MVSRYGDRLSGEQFAAASDPFGAAVAPSAFGACRTGL